jgi:hypothetical protein
VSEIVSGRGRLIRSDEPDPNLLVFAVFAVVGAAIAAFLALTIPVCDEPTAYHCESRFETEKVLAVVGLLPAVSALVAVWLRQNWLAVAFLLVSVLVYAAWGFALDAAIHSSSLP